MIIGVTGSFGSGKTTVARILESFGARVIDADRIARSLIKPKTKIYKKIINTFGEDILNKNQNIDRRKLADIVFGNKGYLNRLNKIIHPQVIRIIKDQIETKAPGFVVLDAPLLIEAGLLNLVDKLIVVRIDRRRQIDRLLRNSSLTKSEVLKRIKAQLPLQHKIRLADFVIDNRGTIRETRRQVKKILEEIELGP